MTFGERLRQEREAKGFTREALAAASGVPFGTIHGYEIGRRWPSFANVVKLAAALELTCEVFADCTDIAAGDEDSAPANDGKKGARPEGGA